MKQELVAWMNGATDGHAKNFSVFIERGGSYRLTPFYDVISAYPVLGGTGLNIRDLKLAMGLKATKGKKMEIEKIFPRHFMATAKAVNFDQNRMVEIMDFFITQFPDAIRQVERMLPADFPPRIADVLFSQSLRMLARLQQ
ncbi:HipA domain-containing protein [Pantoea sp. At-9b]|uniref:HipA domain-containing protein n=1 Tax=Pantoea sp. (strain At-9b) TaxID=592316 RepID=UPI0001B3EB6A|nr:HipA domain-containing protein [Pantoea sp. At-9b]ADU71643.1 HipA domain protein [Pantoea sp. At-9b]